jgi:hypothetical protein
MMTDADCIAVTAAANCDSIRTGNIACGDPLRPADPAPGAGTRLPEKFDLRSAANHPNL